MTEPARDERLYGSGADVHRFPIVESPHLPRGAALLVPAGFPWTVDDRPVTFRPQLGRKAAIRQLVRDGMADVLAWLGDNAPPPLPDEEQWDRWRILAEQRVGMAVVPPRSMVTGTFAP